MKFAEDTPLLPTKPAPRRSDAAAPTWWRRVKDGTLPQPIRVGGLTRWVPNEVGAAIERATAVRDDEAA